jgi:hypothetical protein
MQFHYLNHNHFQLGDTKLATRYATKLMHQNGALTVVTFLVYSKQQYEPFLGELELAPDVYKNHGCAMKDGRIQIHTCKTYNPDYLFAGNSPSEILIAVGVPPKALIKYEDKSNIAHCIIVPWTLDENHQLLSIYEAVDMETGESFPKPEDADERIVNAINWLKSTSFPNEGYHHSLDSNRLHQIANALKKNKVPFEYASTVYCGIHSGLIPSAARKTADAFEKAQNRLFAVEKDTDYSFLKKVLETRATHVLD